MILSLRTRRFQRSARRNPARWLLCFAAAIPCVAGSGQPPNPAVDPFLKLLPPCPVFERWLRANAQNVPDITSLAPSAFLPDPLRFRSGAKVEHEEWQARRQEILTLAQQYLLGAFPPTPEEVRSVDHRSREEAGALVEHLTLQFGPEFQARLGLEVILPRSPPPFPVLVLPASQRAWGAVAVSRGYAACLYSADDEKDDTGAWTKIWPEAQWGHVTRRAWAIGRCLDYLRTLPFVDVRRIAVAGQGRSAQVALIAAAFDQRVNAIIAASSGLGGACSFRLFAEPQMGPGLEGMTRLYPGWWRPSARLFAGREQHLPIDANSLVACVAPRPCLLSTAANDSSEDLWAVEQTYHSAVRSFELLGHPHDLNLHYRVQAIEVTSEDFETYCDWLDTVFGRTRFLFPDTTLFPTYTAWKKLSGEEIDLSRFPTNLPTPNLLQDTNGAAITGPAGWTLQNALIRERVLWALGQAPPFVENAYTPDPQTALLAPPRSFQEESVPFGNSLRGDLYFPTNVSGQALPVLIWLHPASVSTGHLPPFLESLPPYLSLLEQHVAVFAFDQIGYGSRVGEVRNFYARYPHWSLLGKMVEDTLAAVETLRAHPRLDNRRIFLLGYAQGGWIALHAAALDERIAGVITVAGLYTTDVRHGADALARWTGWLPLTPRLGAFIDSANQIPYDGYHLLALIAPRPALVLAPRHDRLTPLSAVTQSIQIARPIYELLGAGPRLQLDVLDDYNRFTPGTLKQIASRLPALLQLPK